jgi:glutamate/tyrosine decarboxylase-like PLP-dependent enzyme
MLSGSQRPILLSFYLMVRALGSSGIARVVDSHMDRAIEFAEVVRELGYIVLTRPMTPLVVFRHPKVLDEIALHALCDRLVVSGVFLSTTTFSGFPWFRAVLINPEISIGKAATALGDIAREL